MKIFPLWLLHYKSINQHRLTTITKYNRKTSEKRRKKMKEEVQNFYKLHHLNTCSVRHYRCKKHKNWWTIGVVNEIQISSRKNKQIYKGKIELYEAVFPLCIVYSSMTIRSSCNSDSKERINVFSLFPLLML